MLRVERGSVINLKDGKQGVVTRIGMSDFTGEPYPIYVQVPGEPLHVYSCLMNSSPPKYNLKHPSTKL